MAEKPPYLDARCTICGQPRDAAVHHVHNAAYRHAWSPAVVYPTSKPLAFLYAGSQGATTLPPGTVSVPRSELDALREIREAAEAWRPLYLAFIAARDGSGMAARHLARQRLSVAETALAAVTAPRLSGVPEQEPGCPPRSPSSPPTSSSASSGTPGSPSGSPRASSSDTTESGEGRSRA